MPQYSRTLASPPRNGRITTVGLPLIVAAFALLAVTYGAVTPPFEMADESSHLMVVSYLQRHRALQPLVVGPRQDTGPNIAAFLAYHEPPAYYAPPLYYALGALLVSPLDMSDLPRLLVPNPRWELGWALTADTSLEDKGFYAHRFREETWTAGGGSVRALYILRGFSLLPAAVTLLCIHGAVRRLWPGRPRLALGAVATAAFTPQFIATSVAVTNDTLTNALFALSFLYGLALMGERHRRRHWLGFGGLVGLALLTKQSALMLLPLGLFVALCGNDERPLQRLRQGMVRAALFLGGAVAVGGWWYARNALLYADPLGMAAHLGMQVPLSRFGLREALTILDTYWATFGWALIRVEPLVYRLVRAAALIALAGVAWSLLPGHALWAEPRFVRRGLAVLAAGALLNAALLVRWALATGAPLGRLLYPSIVPIAVLAAWGMAQWAQWKPVRSAYALALACLVAFAALAPWRYLRPAFRSPLVSALPARAQPLGAAFENGVSLAGYVAEPSPGSTLQPGQSVDLTLYWRAGQAPGERYRAWVQLGPWNAFPPLVVADTWLGGALYPSDLWAEGDLVEQRFRFTVPADAPGPRLYWVRVGMVVGEERVELEGGTESPDVVRLGPWDPTVGQAATVGPWCVWAPVTTMAEHRAGYRFGEGIRLQGYTVRSGPGEGGTQIDLTLLWQAERPLPQDYPIRVQLVDAASAPLGEDQSPPQDGEYPTSWWRPQELVAQPYRFLVREWPTGGAWARVDVLDRESGAPLAAYRPEGERVEQVLLSLDDGASK